MLKYIKGDLIKSDCDIIIHGCNCYRTMGSGIAKQIKETYPEAYDIDSKTMWGDKDKLGTFTHIKTKNKYFPEKDIIIVNAYTQHKYGREKGKIYADYKAIHDVMIKINDFFVDTDMKKLKIGMPKIGAGLAQGDWGTISEIIHRAFADRITYIYEWENNEPYKFPDTNKYKKELCDAYEIFKKKKNV